MPDTPTAPANAAESAPSLSESLDAALEQFPQEPTQESPAAEPETPPEAAASIPEQTSEPEHIRWAKSVSGNFDKETNQFHIDRLTKQAYELNKQNQSTAQNLARLNAVLQHPEVAQALNRVLGNAPAQPQPQGKTPEGERTDEQILDEFVTQRAAKLIQPILPQVSMLKTQYVNSEVDRTYWALKEEFGTAEDGNTAVYDTVRDQVAEQVASAASAVNMSVPQFIETLVDRGILYQVFSSATKQILFPQLRQMTTAKQAQAATAKIEAKKGLRPSVRGGNTRSVQSEPEYKDFWEAAAAAEKELAKK